jgi:hypothetical protein
MPKNTKSLIIRRIKDQFNPPRGLGIERKWSNKEAESAYNRLLEGNCETEQEIKECIGQKIWDYVAI